MKRILAETVHCPFCNSQNVIIRYKFEECAICKCKECELMWLHPPPDIDQIHEVYKGIDYYANHEFFSVDGLKLYGYVDYIGERLNKQYSYQKVVTNIKKLLVQRAASGDFNYTWLDIGCGLGFLMDVAFDSEFRVHGIEFNPEAINYISSKYTFPVYYGMLSEIEFSEKYDIISMFDVIEHLSDPFGDLQKVRHIIKDNGYLLIQTMDSESLVSRLLGRQLEDFRRTREHLFFFSRTSLKTILEHYGWKVDKISSIGHTFQLSFLIDRFSVYSPFLSRMLKLCIYPKWLLDANIYINPGTKMLVYARPI